MSYVKRGVIVLVMVVVLAAALSAFLSVTRVKPAMAEITGLPTIVIDAGHHMSSKLSSHLPYNTPIFQQ